MKITKVGTHHSGPLSPTDPYSSSMKLTEYQIEAAHKARDFNLSAMGFYIGYNLVIYPDGTRKQYRLLGEQTAAATGSNFDTFHICLIGNFTRGVDKPTKGQLETLQIVLNALMENKPELIGLKVKDGTDMSFTPYNVFPHRILQPNHTSCHGDALDDNFGRAVAFDYVIKKNVGFPALRQALVFIASLFKSSKLGSINDDKEHCNFNYKN